MIEKSAHALEASRHGAKEKTKLREGAESLLWAVVIFLAVRTCLVQSFEIPTASMENTLLVGDCLLVNKFLFGIEVPYADLRLPKVRVPKRGEVLVFRFPEDDAKAFVKRVVGLPGDEILVKEKALFVNGTRYLGPCEIHADPLPIPAGTSPRDHFGPLRVPAGSYFVMGDNRDNSYDSRFFGVVGEKNLIGPALVTYWSWDRDRGRVRWDRIGRLIR